MNENIPELKIFFDETSRLIDTINVAENNAELTALSLQIEPYIVNWDDLKEGLKDIDNNNKYSDEQKINNKKQLLIAGINSNNTLISVWCRDPDFKTIASNDMALKNLILYCKYKKIEPTEFINFLHEAGLDNNEIITFLNINFSDYLSKNIYNFNPADLKSPKGQEIFQVHFMENFSNVLKNTNNKLPKNAFLYSSIIELIATGNPEHLTISEAKETLSMKDIQTTQRLHNFLLNNFHEISNDSTLQKPDAGANEITEYMSNVFEITYNEEEKKWECNPNNENLSKIFPDKNFTSNDLKFILDQSTIIFSNIKYTNSSIPKDNQLLAEFIINEPEKYVHYLPSPPSKNLANEITNSLKNNLKYPKEKKEEILIFILSHYSVNNSFSKTIFKETENEFPDLKNKLIDNKINYLSKILNENPQNINRNFAANISENDKPDVIKALMPLANLSIDSNVLNYIKKKKNIGQYVSVTKNILEAKSINDIKPETITFFEKSTDINDAIILLSRLDLIKPIIEKMQKRNDIINDTIKLFNKANISDKNIFSNQNSSQSFEYLLQNSSDSSFNIFAKTLQNTPETQKMCAEIEKETKTRAYIKEANNLNNESPNISREELQVKLLKLNSVIHPNENESKIFSLIPKDKNTQTTKIDNKVETK